jgi:hypothetical protein
MLTRRITACACALALAVPAAAAARPATDPPAKTNDHAVSGDTKYDLQNKQDLGSPAVKGDTKADVKPSYADKVGSLSAEQLAAAYGTERPKGTPVASPVADSPDDGTNGWRIAAVAEAAVLAAIALGSAAFVGRFRPRRGAAA